MSNSKRDTALSSLADLTMGQSPDSSSVSSEEGGLPFLQGCAEFGRVFPQPKFYCSPPLHVGKAGSTLLSVRAPVGTANIADQDYCIGRGLAAVLAKRGVSNNSFLFYAIQHNVAFLHRRSQGSTFLAIGSKDLSQLPVPDLKISEQSRIAEILSTIDKEIEHTEALIAKYQQIKSGMMHDLFTRGLDIQGHLRPHYSEAPQLYRNTPIGQVPNEWATDSLLSFAAPRSGSFVNGPFGSNLLTSEMKESGVSVVYVQDIKEDEYHRVSTACVDESKADELIVCNVKPDDILVAKVGDPPGTAAVYQISDRAVITQDVIRIRPAGDVNAQFLASLLNSSVGKRAVRRITMEGTRARFSLTEYKRLLMPKPSQTEQRMIAERSSTIQALISSSVIELGKLYQMRSGMMNDLLSQESRSNP